MKNSIIIVQLFICLTCYGQLDKKTEVKSFRYGGFSDTIVALLSFELLFYDSESDTNKICLLIRNTKNENEPDSLIIPLETTVGFSRGFYNLEIIRKGFDIVKIKNYYAVPDQVSQTMIFFKRGQDTITYFTSPPKYLFPKNGIDTTYYENGKIKEIKSFINNDLINHIKYFESGLLQRKMNFIDEGLIYLIEYFGTGQIKFIAVYNQGTTIGFRTEYYENGTVKEHLINTEAGQKTWEFIDSNGNYIIKEGKQIKK